MRAALRMPNSYETLKSTMRPTLTGSTRTRREPLLKSSGGSLQDYIGQKALNPFIDKDKVLQETIRFSIPR